jgi:hypothetical protein
LAAKKVPPDCVAVDWTTLLGSKGSPSAVKIGEEKTGESDICGVVRRGEAIMTGDICAGDIATGDAVVVLFGGQ